MKVALIVLHYNSSSDCLRCMSDLLKQHGISFELVVVDNASLKSEKELVEEFCRQVGCTFLANNENRGYNAGNNVGLRYAAAHGAELAMIVNPDMRFPDAEYVAALSKVFELDKNIAVAASDILDAEGRHQNPQPPERGWRSAFTWLSWIAKSRSPQRNVDFSESGECRKVSGCCFMIRMDFLRDIGYFDEYPFLYCEEAILAAQVLSAGKKIYYLAERQAIHRHIAGTKGNLPARARHLCRSRIYYHRRYSTDGFFGKALAVCSYRIWYGLISLRERMKWRKQND